MISEYEYQYEPSTSLYQVILIELNSSALGPISNCNEKLQFAAYIYAY
jgi:hypothetical protein